MKTVLALATSLVCASFGMFAQADDIDCSKAYSTVEINYCASLDLQAADAVLNQAYQKILPTIQAAENTGVHGEYNGITDLFVNAELAWIASRDADCLAVQKTWGNGTGRTSAYLFCKTAKTKERTTFLQKNYINDRT